MARSLRPRGLESQVDKVRKCGVLSLSGLFGRWLGIDGGPEGSFYERIFSPERLFWLFLWQVLSVGRSCRETLAGFLALMAVENDRIISQSTSAYCQGRKRLPGDWLEKLAASARDHLQGRADGLWLWLGRRVKVVDGTTVSMPDTPANQSAYPQPASQKAGCGFPQMRLACAFCLATGGLLDWACGPLADHERTLWRRLWPGLRPGDIVLADRGFCGFADIWHLLERGVDCVMRANALRGVGVREVRRLGEGDRIVEWVKTKVCPRWLDEEAWTLMPPTITLREISYSAPIEGFRTKTVKIVTTLLDDKTFPAACFADLYRRRWAVELFLRDIKISMGMDILRCKSPRMVEKELLMHLIGYNLIRLLMLEAADQYPIEPTALSFKATTDMVRQWAPVLASTRSLQQRQQAEKILLYYIAHLVVPQRPNRIEPRARKRRPKNYQLLTQPRHKLQIPPHRNRQTKAKS